MHTELALLCLRVTDVIKKALGGTATVMDRRLPPGAPHKMEKGAKIRIYILFSVT